MFTHGAERFIMLCRKKSEFGMGELKMIETITSINKAVNNIVWGVPAMVLILGVGLYLTLRSKGLQFRKFVYAMKQTIGRIFEKKEAAAGSVTPFQAVCTALAATVGTGNIAGVAGAIALGGPGAVFWMWVSALLGMCTKFAEVTLAVHYRERNSRGDWVGGPMYFIKNGLKKNWHWLAVLFAVLGSLASFGTGNATQASTVKSSINSMLYNFGIVASPDGNFWVNLLIGVTLAVVLIAVLIGGIKRIGRVAEKLVPFMAVLYIVLALGVVIVNIKSVPGVFASIFEGAFNPKAMTGGIVGSMFMTMQKGIARGIFSNEAGLGSASIAHASADTDNAVHQGLFGIFEVFADTVIICTLTALVVLCAGQGLVFGQNAGAELTISGFTATYGGWVSILSAVAICCFAFSTTIGWGLYGARCVEFLLGEKAIKPYQIVYSLIAIVGVTMNVGLLWDIADTFNGMMAIPNLIAVALLSPVVFRLTKEYFSKGNALKR